MEKEPLSEKSNVVGGGDPLERGLWALRPRLEKMIRESLRGNREFVEIRSVREEDGKIKGFVMTRSPDRQQNFLHDLEVRLTSNGAIEYLEVDGKRIKVKEG